MHILYEEGDFEPSSPVCHATELAHILQEEAQTSPILFLHSDGVSDHRVTYMSVKLTMTAVFLKLDLDYLCASCTALYHSYRDPAERVMSILNWGL